MKLLQVHYLFFKEMTKYKKMVVVCNEGTEFEYKKVFRRNSEMNMNPSLVPTTVTYTNKDETEKLVLGNKFASLYFSTENYTIHAGVGTKGPNFYTVDSDEEIVLQGNGLAKEVLTEEEIFQDLLLDVTAPTLIEMQEKLMSLEERLFPDIRNINPIF